MASLSTLKRTTATLALMAMGWSGAAFAACDNNLPANGATVACNPTAPNPDTNGVGPLNATDATLLPTGVTVNVLNGASISLPGTVGFPVVRLGQGANVNLAAGSSISTANSGGIGISVNPNGAAANSIVDIAGSITSRGTGISFFGPAATITLRQGGTINSGSEANGGNPGIFIQPTGASPTNVQIDGAITVLGNTGVGTGAVQSLTATGSRATITLGSTGTINTSGTNALGIIAQGPSTTVNVAGTITTSGAAASGVVANGSGTPATSRTVIVNPTGRINTSGDNAAGIVFGTVLGSLFVESGAQVRTTGTGNAAALFFLDAASSATQISNFGNLIATNALGVRGVGSLMINNGGTISGTTGIAVTAGPAATSIINNDGTITGTGGVAIDLRQSTGDFAYTIHPTSATNGTVLGGTGVNTLRFNTTTASGLSFDWNRLNSGGAADGDDQYFGFTQFFKLGPNTLTLTGGNGTGPARTLSMNMGTALVNGNLRETAFTVGGGTLGGTGTTGNVSVNSGGTLSAGTDGSIGTLTINGNLVLNAGSTSRFDIGTTAGSNDRINVTGTASLAGTLTALPLGTFTAGRYTLLNAVGGRTGTFNPLTGLPNTVSLAYDANNVFLDVTGEGSVTNTQSLTESVVINAPTTATAQVTNFSTQIIGRLSGQNPVYDQVFGAAFADATVQSGVTDARAAILAAGGTGTIVSDPERTANSSTSSTASATLFALAGTQDTVQEGVTTFGPANLTVGALSTCNVGTLPLATAPTCTTGGTALVLGLNDTNINVNTNRVYTIRQTITDTTTTTIRETYVLTGNRGEFSTTTSERQSIVFTAPNVTTNRVSAFSTQIVGRIFGGTPIFDQTFSAAFADPTVQNGVTAARAAITTVGGPGVIIGAPVRTASAMTSSTATGATTFALTNTQSTVEMGVVTFGPATLTVGTLSTCNVTTLPSSIRPSCATGGTPLVLGENDSNANVNTNTVFTVAENRTDTITDTLRETYELNGQVVAIGSIHAQVQSGLFDLSGRLLTRLGQVSQGRAGWADAYRFRVSQGGRRDAWGLNGGIALPLGDSMTFAAGVGQGGLDIDVSGALENGDVDLTELGAALRYDRDGFGASLAFVHGFGKAKTSRSIIGRSNARYDVKASGAALELGYTYESQGVIVKPMVGLDWARISTDAFTESDTLALVAGKQSVKRIRASAGLALAKDFGKVTLGVSGRYLAILEGGKRGLPVAFALAPARSLAMTGPSEGDGALVGARMEVPLSKAAKLSVRYDGRFGGGYRTHGGTVGVVVSF